VRAIEPAGRGLRVVAAAPAGVLGVGAAERLDEADTFPPGHPIHEVVATGETRVVERVAELEAHAPSARYVAHLRELGVRRAAFVPLVAHGAVIGVLGAAGTAAGRPLDDDAVRLLETLARHATLAVENARLYEDAERLRRRAEEANVSKDQFLATVTHELRTPLNAILGWARILKGGEADAATLAKGLDTIERNAKAQAQLIEDLLDVSRVAVGKLKLAPSAVFVPAAIETAIDSARPAAEAKRVRLEADVDPDVGTIVADPDRFQQVIWNLVSNSVKFTPPGGAVRVRARRADSEFELVVEDDGAGIAPEFLPYVFEKFQQAERGTRKAGGLGLGLAIVRHLVELHGGSVAAESEGAGRGARFTVRFPILAALPPTEAPPAESGEGGGRVPPPPRVLGGARVLVVDDEPDARAIVSAILTQAGAAVRAAGSADEALALLGAELPDALVSDIGMPGKDGYALIRQVRGLPRERGGRLPAVALTAYARSEDRTRALTAGFTMHIPKPVDPTELVVVLANVLGLDVTARTGS
jgi:signal transduction histidine kinase/ActR/RegA family two-component response regulator